MIIISIELGDFCDKCGFICAADWLDYCLGCSEAFET